MNFIKRAWQNVTFKKGRSLLLIIVMTVIMVFIMAGLLIRNAAVTTVNNTKQQVGTSVTLSANRDKAFKKMRQGTSSTTTPSKPTGKPTLKMPSVSLKAVEEITQLSQVANYNVSVTTDANATSFDTISTSSTNTMMGGGPNGAIKSTSSSGDLQLTGVLNMTTLSDFKNGTNKITKGRALTKADVGTKNVVIESELAKQNKLKVGQSIKIKATTTGKTAYTLKIVGIYKASQSSTNGGMGPGRSDPANTIYTSYTLANQVKAQSAKVDSATFTLNDPTQKKAFLKAAKTKINTSKFSLIADDSTYQALKQSMQRMETFADKIVWLVAIAGTIILALIIILMVRERRFEIGVLMALGENRLKIIGQLLVEMLMLLIVSLTIAGVTGQFAGQALGNQMMAQVSSTTTPNNDANQQPGNGGPSGQAPTGQPGGARQMQQGPNNANTKIKQQNLEITISPIALIQLGAMGFAIIALAVLLASANILRLEPRKVLIG